MAKTITDKSELKAPFAELSDTTQQALLTVAKAGQSDNARKAVQTFQRACSDYGSLIMLCGQARHTNSSLSRKTGKVRELSELDCSMLSKEQVKRLGDCIRIRKAWALLTGEF